MRKILLATTALVGFVAAGAAQAATAPLNVTVGGDINFVAGAFHESRIATNTNAPVSADFQTLYSLNFGVTGKAATGFEYGGNLVLDNYPSAYLANYAGQVDGIRVTQADIFVSGAYGKLRMGDFRGATELAVAAPSVGGLQYVDFLNAGTSFAKDIIYNIDTLNYDTNITYYTPKVGNEMGKVQAAVTYVPKMSSIGSDVLLARDNDYKNVVKAAVTYSGNIQKVAVNASAHLVAGDTQAVPATLEDFTSWGFGVQAAYQGFTVGGNYIDLDDYNVTSAQTKDQATYTAGIKYEFGKYVVGFDWMGAEGYSAATYANSYVKDFNSYSFGGAYTWAPGLSTTVNAVFFNQDAATNTSDNEGYVLLVSQKLAF